MKPHHRIISHKQRLSIWVTWASRPFSSVHWAGTAFKHVTALNAAIDRCVRITHHATRTRKWLNPKETIQNNSISYLHQRPKNLSLANCSWESGDSWWIGISLWLQSLQDPLDTEHNRFLSFPLPPDIDVYTRLPPRPRSGVTSTAPPTARDDSPLRGLTLKAGCAANQSMRD